MATESTPGDAQQVLSQTEVEALLAQMSPEPPAGGAAAPASAAVSEAPVPAPAPRRYDFRTPTFLSVAELRQLRLRHDEFIRSLITRLSIYLRVEFEARLAGLDTLSWRRFVDQLPQPANLTVFRIEPLNGMGILDLSPALGTALVDRLLGGPGKPVKLERDFSEIEVEVLGLFQQLVLKEWSQEVTRVADAHPQMLAHETNPRFLEWNNPADGLLVASLELRFLETAGELKLGVPSGMLEPVLRQWNLGRAARQTPTAAPPAKQQWHPFLDDVPVPLHASWADLEITARELARLKVGDVLQVTTAMANQVQIWVGKQPKFRGRLGTRDQAWAVELTGMV